jgi:hypothetical protein
MNKKNIILSLAIVGILGAGTIFAQTSLGDKFANRFNLDPDEVHQFMGEHKQEQMENRLGNAVEDGKITEEQKTLILEKKQEMREECEGLKGLSPEERREAMQEKHDEYKEWAEENGLPLKGFGRGMGQHKGPRR